MLLLTMQAEKQQSYSWKINVSARANNFHLKFKATKIEPTWKFFRFSFFLKLHEILLELKSETGTPSRRQHHRRTLKFKFLELLKKLKTPSAKKRTTDAKKTPNLQHPQTKSPADLTARFAFENPICIGSLLIGTLALLSESISAKDERGIIIHGSSILLFLALTIKTYAIGKARILLVVSTIAAALVGAVVVFFLDYGCMDYEEDYISKLVWKAWNYAASSGCLFVLSRVIFSRFCQSVGVRVLT